MWDNCFFGNKHGCAACYIGGEFPVGPFSSGMAPSAPRFVASVLSKTLTFYSIDLLFV